MIKFEHIDIHGWEAAIRGMRNPMNSWEKSDSYMGYDCHKCGRIDREGFCEPKKHDCSEYYGVEIGQNDHALMMKLARAGSEHSKYRRFITVTMDIMAPLYWWKEFDTYKVGTVANSCSTMHKIHAEEFGLDDFSHEHLLSADENKNAMLKAQIFSFDYDDGYAFPLDILDNTIGMLNQCRTAYRVTKDKRYWWQMIQLLPSSYNQKRTVILNYEVLAHIYQQRKDHKLDEWHEFCNMIRELPYSEIITLEEGQK